MIVLTVTDTNSGDTHTIVAGHAEVSTMFQAAEVALADATPDETGIEESTLKEAFEHVTHVNRWLHLNR